MSSSQWIKLLNLIAASIWYLVKYVLPAIKNKWPLSDRWSTIYIQQDNAKTHVTCDDPVVVVKAAKGNWDISMVFQPPNSPDMNILDLGFVLLHPSHVSTKKAKNSPRNCYQGRGITYGV
jgi:fructose 1,6-bisphosphatase